MAIAAIIMILIMYLLSASARSKTAAQTSQDLENQKRCGPYFEAIRADLCRAGKASGPRSFRIHVENELLAIYKYETHDPGGYRNELIVEFKIDLFAQYARILHGQIDGHDNVISLKDFVPALRDMFGDIPVHRYENGFTRTN